MSSVPCMSMYWFALVAVKGLVAGTTFISSQEEGILKAVPAITTQLQHDPTPLLGIATAAQVGEFFSGPCVYGYTKRPPWWHVDLGADRTVTRVTVREAGSCCHPWLGNFTVLVGSRVSTQGTLYGGQVCATFTGTLTPGTSMTLPCMTPLTGRYVHLTSYCVDMFGTLLSCNMQVTTGVRGQVTHRRSSVFIANAINSTPSTRGGTSDPELLSCARKCLRDTSCVLFQHLNGCQLCRNEIDCGSGGYSLHKLIQ